MHLERHHLHERVRDRRTVAERYDSLVFCVPRRSNRNPMGYCSATTIANLPSHSWGEVHFGGFNFMEFYDDNRVLVNPLRISDTVVAELEASMILFFTGRSRESAAIIEAQTKALDSEVSLNSMHELKNDALAMKEQLLRGSIPGMADVLARSWEAKKKTSNRISNPEIDDIHATAVSAGAYAGKISGAGGGGFFMFIAKPERRNDVLRALADKHGQFFACHFTDRGSISWMAGDAIR